ncbi:MAG: hypothetical protein PWP27_2522, partial [Clostridiales bacterium]|nr:hypothetical protein [Clostridiales bacterium]
MFAIIPCPISTDAQYLSTKQTINDSLYFGGF